MTTNNIFKAFQLTTLPSSVFSKYRTPLDFYQDIKVLSNTELDGYLRQHITEGIPYVFAEQPLLYEAVRTWLANEIQIHAKEITLIGSARVGFSMGSRIEFGRPYMQTSDLDFTIISSSWFKRLSESFDIWKDEYERNIAIPKNGEQRFWPDNMQNVPRNIARGFIDTYKIPNRYAAVQEINTTRWTLSRKLSATDGQFESAKISYRVYKDWTSFTKQFRLNVSSVMSKLTDDHPHFK